MKTNMIKTLKDSGTLGNSFTVDRAILPEHYFDLCVGEPFYRGDGEHSVKELQEICRQFKEYCHQQALIKQELIKYINDENSLF